jgi:hypothetical protein
MKTNANNRRTRMEKARQHFTDEVLYLDLSDIMDNKLVFAESDVQVIGDNLLQIRRIFRAKEDKKATLKTFNVKPYKE